MHETRVVENLVSKIIERASLEKADSVCRISVWLGALSHMSPAHFKEHFDIAAHGTMMENAKLEIEASKDIYDPNAREIILRHFDMIKDLRGK
jgi:hydrogenase nickel incorporation protein HypA/HybF